MITYLNPEVSSPRVTVDLTGVSLYYFLIIGTSIRKRDEVGRPFPGGTSRCRYPGFFHPSVLPSGAHGNVKFESDPTPDVRSVLGERRLPSLGQGSPGVSFPVYGQQVDGVARFVPT